MEDVLDSAPQIAQFSEILGNPLCKFSLQGRIFQQAFLRKTSMFYERSMDAKARMTKHGLLQSNELYQYILETSVYPREVEPLRELRAATHSHPKSFMGIPPDEGQFLSLLLQTINAKKTIEIGVFTGYSLLVTALALPEDGKITAIDIDQEAYNIGLPFIRKAGVERKINFINSDAHRVLDELLEDQNNLESFDFAFVDANKDGYEKYHEKLLKLLKLGGIIAYDNTLFYGTVAMAEENVEDLRMREVRRIIREFNRFIAADSRVQISQAPLGDGITICRRLQ